MIVPKEVNEACSGFQIDRYRTRKTIYTDISKKGYEEGCKFNPNNKIGRK